MPGRTRARRRHHRLHRAPAAAPARRARSARRRRRSPDNVLIVPPARWHALFDALARAQPALVRHQVHANLAHGALPRDPSAAFTHARSGSPRTSRRAWPAPAIVGNNLATALDARARRQPLCARRVPLPRPAGRPARRAPDATIAARRRRTAAPRPGAAARTRRDASAILTRLALAESLLVGLARRRRRASRAALADRRLAFGSASFGPASAIRGRLGRASRWPRLAVAALAIALPAWRDARRAHGGPARARRAAHALAAGGRALWHRPPRDRRSASLLFRGDRGATATSSCSPPRAPRRSRSTTGRSSRRCWRGSASACSATASPSSRCGAGAALVARPRAPISGGSPARSPRA